MGILGMCMYIYMYGGWTDFSKMESSRIPRGSLEFHHYCSEVWLYIVCRKKKKKCRMEKSSEDAAARLDCFGG